MTHAHMTSWALALILFVVAIFLLKAGKAKGAKIVQMIARVVYLLILATGFMLLFSNGNMLGTDLAVQYIIKVILGFGVIGLFEMILAKTSKKKPTGVLWILFFILFALVLFMGFKLPM
jgi:peptidoglycan/LPS O-acetylase OafA/YrhL